MKTFLFIEVSYAAIVLSTLEDESTALDDWKNAIDDWEKDEFTSLDEDESSTLDDDREEDDENKQGEHHFSWIKLH